MTREITGYATLRKHPRIALAEPVSLESAANPKTRDERIIELGPGGMFVETDTPDPIGSLVEFCFHVPGAQRIEGKASVLYRASLDGRAGIGMRFVGLGEELQNSVSEFVNARLRAASEHEDRIEHDGTWIPVEIGDLSA